MNARRRTLMPRGVAEQCLREMYATCTAEQIANLIYGSRRHATLVYQWAARLGLRKLPPRDPDLPGKVRQLHAEGLLDPEIARRIGIDRRTVAAVRARRLGLPVNAAALLAAQHRAVRSQQATLGIKSGGELRKLAYRRFAQQNGWPENLAPREVQILNVLASRGVPMTRLELSRAIGMRTDRMGRRRHGGTLTLLAGNGPGGTYTASLMRRGLLVGLGRLATVRGRGRGRSRCLYALGPEALAILQRRARCERNQTAV